MILYHFTSRFSVKAVQREGLTKGMIPIGVDKRDQMRIYPGVQWLTEEPDWNQAWDVNAGLPMRRTDYRFTIEIPMYRCLQCVNVETFNRFKGTQFIDVIRTIEGYKYWRIYIGKIPPNWIMCIDKNPIGLILDESVQSQ